MDIVEQGDTAFISTRLYTTIQHRTSVRLQNYATVPHYARSIVSIMPGLTWRDTGHKALMPGVTFSKFSILRREAEGRTGPLPRVAARGDLDGGCGTGCWGSRISKRVIVGP